MTAVLIPPKKAKTNTKNDMPSNSKRRCNGAPNNGAHLIFIFEKVVWKNHWICKKNYYSCFFLFFLFFSSLHFRRLNSIIWLLWWRMLLWSHSAYPLRTLRNEINVFVSMKQHLMHTVNLHHRYVNLILMQCVIK